MSTDVEEVRHVWEADDFISKAKAYFERASTVHDDETRSLWLLLGLEFLLKAPLAHLNPVLLLDVVEKGDLGRQVLALYGVTAWDGPARLISRHVVDARVRLLIPELQQADLDLLRNLRNAEVHDASRFGLVVKSPRYWYAQLERVVRPVCDYLSEDADDVVGQDVMAEARLWATQDAEQVADKVRDLIARHLTYFTALTVKEVNQRKWERDEAWAALQPSVLPGLGAMPTPTEFLLEPGGVRRDRVACPCCGQDAWLTYFILHRGTARVDEEYDNIVVHGVFIADSFRCYLCKIDLRGVAELSAAGLEPRTEADITTAVDHAFRHLLDVDYYDFDDDSRDADGRLI